ncbi:MAG: hypothetical protein M3O31_03360 [Acidobacteriota bacterium]|nr:hypothetical protein [Acidobacteriota bacterium]
MTTSQAAYAAILAMDGPPARRIDRIRARMGANRSVRNLESVSAFRPEEQTQNPRLHLVADTRGTWPARGPHPGDVLYWVACLGGACLLLLCATT